MAGYVDNWGRAQAEELLRQILDSQSQFEDVLYRDARLVAELVADGVRTSGEMVASVALKLTRLALRTPHVVLRRAAMDALEKMGRETDLTDVLDLVLLPDTTDDPETRLRKALIRVKVTKSDRTPLLREVSWSLREGIAISDDYVKALGSPHPSPGYLALPAAGAPFEVDRVTGENLIDADPRLIATADEFFEICSFGQPSRARAVPLEEILSQPVHRISVTDRASALW